MDSDNETPPPIPSGKPVTDGTSTHDGTETDVDTERFDEEEHVDGLDEPVLNSIEGDNSSNKEDEEKNSRTPMLLCCLAILCCIGIIVLLVLFFMREDMPLARAQLDPSTNAPTFELETDSPTPLGETEKPTPEPTSGPTPSPTLPPISPSGEKSRLTCEEINLAAAEAPGDNLGDGNFRPIETLPDGTQVCGDTFGGRDPQRPNRNYWSVRLGRRNCPRFTYDEGFKKCDEVGARWCTVDEFIAEVAHGSGCGGDREFVYTNTDCLDDDTGLPGKVMFDVGLRDKRKPFFFCESDMSRLSLARCCGDAVL